MTGDRSMDSMWHPSAWIALLRIGVGAYFAKAIFTKLTLVHVAGFIAWPVVSPRWIAVMPRLVAKQAAGNPVAWYRDFLANTVLPHSVLFAHLTAWGEVVAGILLVLGLLTGVGAVLGIWLVANYGLASQWVSPSQLVMHVLLLALLGMFFLARAGRYWGIDALLVRRHHGWVTHRPWS